MGQNWPKDYFRWWSANSARNGRGSIMAYVRTPDGHVPWYVALAAPAPWRLTRVVGLGGSEIDSALSLDLSDPGATFTSSVNSLNNKSIVL